jgi:hypothetical protein
MVMPGRKYLHGTSTYRYSINGQEKESELNDNITNALYWEYDSRIVRRWNIDPKQKIEESPFLCFSGNPIWFSDILGDLAQGPGPKIPNLKIGTIPVYMGDFEFPKIHNIDLEYSKTERGKKHSIKIELPIGRLTLLAMTVEKNIVNQEANRKANKAANPTQVGNRAAGTAGHEVPYASTQQGGALAMRKVTDAKQNSDHGNSLLQFYKEFNLNTGDIFIVALFEPTPKMANPSPQTDPVPQSKPVTVPDQPVIIPSTRLPLPRSVNIPKIPTPLLRRLIQRVPVLTLIPDMWDAFDRPPATPVVMY